MLTERIESVRSVALGIWFRQGRVHEPTPLQGVSHLLEHMVFKGTGRRSALDLVLEIEGVGGSLDAYTTHEWTGYQVRVPDEALHGAVDVLCDLAFAPRLDAADLESEREVVLEELASIEDAPDELAFELHARALYDGHPYGEPIIGTADSVRSIQRADLVRLHEGAYLSSNAIVAAAGHLEHEDILALVRRHVPAAGEAGSPAPQQIASPAPRTGATRVERPGGTQSHIVVAGPTVPHRDPLRFAVALVDTALGGGMSSRLFQRIREELGLAYTVYSFSSFFSEAGHAGAYVGTKPERAGAAGEALLEELQRVAVQGLSADEIATTKSQLKGRVSIALESTSARMNRLAGVCLYQEPYRTLDQLIGQIDRITVEQVHHAASFFHPDRTAVLELAPA